MSEPEVDAQSRGRQLIQQAADAFWAEKYPNDAVTYEYRLGFYVAHQLMEEEGITLDRLNAAIEASSIAEAGRLSAEREIIEVALAVEKGQESEFVSSLAQAVAALRTGRLRHAAALREIATAQTFTANGRTGVTSWPSPPKHCP